MTTLWLLRLILNHHIVVHTKNKGEIIMMKDKYMSPEMEIIEFDNEDVITTSPVGVDDTQTPPLR